MEAGADQRKPFAADNPEGLTFLLARLDAKDLIALPKNAAVLRAIVDRPGIDAASRRGRHRGLATLENVRPAQALVDAIERLDGEPGTRTVVQDLSQVLTTLGRAALAGVRSDLATLATLGKDEMTRRARSRDCCARMAGPSRRGTSHRHPSATAWICSSARRP